MAHRTGQNRQQFGLFATPLDEMIAPDNMVRVIDAFVDAIDLEQLGFVHVRAHRRGAPPYSPGLLLKIYIYGYFNRVRSSRRLELQKCADHQISTYVAYPDQDYKTKEEGFRKEDFEYDAEKDVYICPVGEELTTNDRRLWNTHSARSNEVGVSTIRC